MLHFRKLRFCTLCNKELRFKYKPDKSWNMNGFLCSDCHINKTREFVIKQKEEEEKMKEKQNYCFTCNKYIKSEEEKKKPRWQWDMEYNAFLCQKCFERKELDYQKRINFCIKCGKKIGFVRYNPKPKWQIDGQLCRECWDSINNNQS